MYILNTVFHDNGKMAGSTIFRFSTRKVIFIRAAQCFEEMNPNIERDQNYRQSRGFSGEHKMFMKPEI